MIPMGWLREWGKRVKITIDHSKIDAPLFNFPILLYLSASSGQHPRDVTFVFNEIGANSKKIAVTQNDGTTQLYVEIEKWDYANKKARLWVKVPHIASDIDTDLYLYYDKNHADNVDYVGYSNSLPAKNVWSNHFVYVRHMRDEPRALIDLLQYHKRLIEGLFPKNWFFKTKKRNHPAYIRWDLCNRMIKQNGVVKFPEQRDELTQIGSIMLDSYILSQITGGDIKDLSLRPLSYGDKAFQEKILSRVTDENQFEDIMVELYIGAWHLSNGHKVTPVEEEGLPDLRIEFPNVTYPAFIECKHLRTRTKRRVIDLVRKANNQIKKINGQCYGIMIVDATLPVAAGIVKDDRLPAQIQEISKVIRSALSGEKNRSIGTTLVVWDDNTILGQPPEKTLVTLRRRHIRINHNRPNTVVPRTLPLFNGFNVDFFVSWYPRTRKSRKN